MGIIQKLQSKFSSKRAQEQTLYDSLYTALGGSAPIYIGELLAFAADKFTHETALIMGERQLTYKELYFRAVLLSKHLQSLGLKPRDRVLLMAENSIEFYISYFAAWQAGAIVAPLNLFLHPKEIAHIINDAKPTIILTSADLKKKFEEAFTESDVSPLPRIVTQESIDWTASEPETMAEIHQLFTCELLGEDELSLLLYTSGTTGSPKGVMLSSRNIITNTLQSASRLGMFREVEDQFFRERFFAALPLFHVFAQNGCIWLPLMVGGTVVVVPRVDRSEILDGLKHKPTIFFGVPALYGLLCLLKTAPLDSVRLFISGGDAIPNKIRSAFAMVYGRKICSGYGLTEASPVIAVNVDNQEAHTNVVGAPLVGITCQIRDENGSECADGEVGTLWVKGDNVMLGYYGALEATKAVLQDGWLCTGDLAMIDTDGNLAIIGRSKDLIIHKGFNIYPQEVENVLMSHPSVQRAAVIGREDALSGQVPVAFVALKDSGDECEKALREFCSSHLASYKIPRKIICLDDLPMNATGKIDKKQLSGEML